MFGYRNNDAVLIICQNNEAKSIEITGLNDAASEFIGYDEKELLNHPLVEIVSPHVAELIHEYVEYEEGGNDVGQVLAKQAKLHVMCKDKRERNYRMKVVRDTSTIGHSCYRLVLQSLYTERKDEALHKAIEENFKGYEVLDKALQIPNRASLVKDVDIVGHYHHKAKLRASLIVMQPDYIAAYQEQYGEKECADLFRHMIGICRNNLRARDVVAVVNEHQLGILLLDSISDLTRMIANRLRWQMTAHPFTLKDKTVLNLSVSIVHADIDGKLKGEDMVAFCEKTLAAVPADKASHLSDITSKLVS